MRKKRMCPATLDILGRRKSCKYECSSKDFTHPAEHEAEVQLTEGQGITVTWSYWQVVKPPRL